MSDRRLLFNLRKSDFDLICDIGDDKDVIYNGAWFFESIDD